MLLGREAQTDVRMDVRMDGKVDGRRPSPSGVPPRHAPSLEKWNPMALNRFGTIPAKIAVLTVC